MYCSKDSLDEAQPNWYPGGSGSQQAACRNRRKRHWAWTIIMGIRAGFRAVLHRIMSIQFSCRHAPSIDKLSLQHSLSPFLLSLSSSNFFLSYYTHENTRANCPRNAYPSWMNQHLKGPAYFFFLDEALTMKITQCHTRVSIYFWEAEKILHAVRQKHGWSNVPSIDKILAEDDPNQDSPTSVFQWHALITFISH